MELIYATTKMRSQDTWRKLMSKEDCQIASFSTTWLVVKERTD